MSLGKQTESASSAIAPTNHSLDLQHMTRWDDLYDLAFLPDKTFRPGALGLALFSGSSIRYKRLVFVDVSRHLFPHTTKLCFC